MQQVLRSMGAFLLVGALLVMAWAWVGPGIPTAHAGDRALLIGVGDLPYMPRGPSNPLPGIDLDLKTMSGVVRNLGFSNIRVLQNSEATLAGVEAAIDNFLIRDVHVQPEDRLLFYFSGHGSLIPDEYGVKDNKVDSVLLLYDTEQTTRNGHATLKGVLEGHRIAELLPKMPSRKVLMLVDACHSATVDKSIRVRFGDDEEKIVDKFFYYPGMPTPLASKGMTTCSLCSKEMATGNANYVLIAAAQEDEKTPASSRGSPFTLGIRQTVDSHDTAQLTPRTLHQDVSSYVADYVANHPTTARPVHPQMGGNPKLADESLNKKPSKGAKLTIEPGQENKPITPPPVIGNPNWRQLENLTKSKTSLTVTTNKNQFSPGDLMEVSVEVPESGYLNLIYVSEKDKPTLIFPNAFQKNNKVSKGTFRIPGRMPFDLPASGNGKNLIMAIWSKNPTDLFAGSHKGLEKFVELSSEAIEKEFNPVERTRPTPAGQTATRAGKQIVEVCAGC